jgi:branched-subunit amino acid transport protein AzlD
LRVRRAPFCVRAKLLVLFILMAALDTGGKVVERDHRLLSGVHGLVERLGIRARARPGRSGNNLDIFRSSSRHLIAGQDLYASYPAEHRDLFKYSPTFAFLFIPLAYLPWGWTLLLWQLLNALALFYALTRLLKGRTADLAIGIVFLEVWRSMQNVQSNSLVAACIVLAFVGLEERRHPRAASFIGVGAAIKLFPVVAGVFALPTRHRWRLASGVLLSLAVMALLPLLVTSPAQLLEQYRSWLFLEQVDARAHMQSVMGLLHLMPGLGDVPNAAIQLLGLGVLVAPLLVRAHCWHERQFRLEMLASTLLYVVLFNHQAERASYVIAFTGIAIWYLTASRGPIEHALLLIAFLAIPVASLFIPGRWIRSPEVTVVRLVVPCLLIWLKIQLDMLRVPYTERAPLESGLPLADPVAS